MKANEKKKSVVRITEGNMKVTADERLDGSRNKIEALKKPVIFALMGVVFLGCMYLIFKPSPDNMGIEKDGLNVIVPAATGKGMPADKIRAYEQEMLERKDREKRNALTTLSDYWNTEDQVVPTDKRSEVDDGYDGLGNRVPDNPAMKSYHNAQSTLGSFYRDDNAEAKELRRQLDELREQLAEQEVPRSATLDDQLALMEKSYEMAAKYLPTGTIPLGAVPSNGAAPDFATSNQKEPFVSFGSTRKNAVSTLYREPTDSAFLAYVGQRVNRSFYTVGPGEQVARSRNSVMACVQETRVIIGESGVRLRLLEPARTPVRTIPKGTIVTANAKFQGGRLQLKVTSLELEGSIVPVDITIYDLDGQQGLYVPYSPEINALSEMAGNMGQTSGTSVMLAQSAGQQVAADLGRGVVQGISGYFSKKVRTPKVTLKAGHQVLLVSKQ